MKKLMAVIVQGNNHRWSFQFEGDPAHVSDWLADGLNIAFVDAKEEVMQRDETQDLSGF